LASTPASSSSSSSSSKRVALSLISGICVSKNSAIEKTVTSPVATKASPAPLGYASATVYYLI